MDRGGIVALLAGLELGDRLLTEESQLAAFGSDALTAFYQRPLAVVVVESAAEVEAVVRLCHRAGVPFVARGSGTSLSGGSLPVGERDRDRAQPPQPRPLRRPRRPHRGGRARRHQPRT